MIRNVAAGLALAAAILLATTDLAGAAPPSRSQDTVNVNYLVPFYSQLCGTPVTFSVAGSFDTTIRYDRAGSVISETDTQPGATVTFSSPYRSFSFPFASVLTTTYAGGAGIGADAIATGRGLAGKIPGIPADAGAITYRATVVAITPSGVPIVAFDGVLDLHGHENDPAAADAAICEALAA